MIKKIRREIVKLGFHHAWHYMINDIDSSHRIMVKRTNRKNIQIYVTKDHINFDNKNAILIRETDNVSEKIYLIKKYFGLLTIFDYNNKEALPQKFFLN